MRISIKSRLLATLLTVTVILGSMPFFNVTASAADIAAGSGSAEDPYQITSADELMAFNNVVNVTGNRGAHAILKADIDMTGKDWKPLGVYSDVGGYNEGAFSGTFDGNGYIISNLTIYCTTPIETGFVSRSQGATLKNITIVNADVTNTAYTRTGILGGELFSSTVENCFTTGEITVTEEAKETWTSGNQRGGIAGEAASTTLKNCATSLSVIANGTGYQNCFYVAASDNDGLQGTTNIPSADMIATGEAAYLMNEALGSTVWYQNIDATETADLAPVASNAGGRSQVYKVNVYACPNNTELKVSDTFSNTNQDQTKKTHTYTNGVCDYCSAEVTAEELTEARAEAKSKLNSYVDADDYRTAEQTQLASAISNAEASIDSANTYEQIDAALAAGKTAIDGIKTDADYLREELESYMAPKRQELQNYVDKTLYREAQQALIDQAIADGIAEINKCTTENAINEALAAAKAAIDKIPNDLDMYKQEAIELLSAYKNSGDYRQSDYLPAFNRGKNEILACIDKAAVDTALANAKTYLDQLKTDAELSAEEQLTNPNMVLTNNSFETGSFNGWSTYQLSAKPPEVIKASDEEVDDNVFLTAQHGDYVYKFNPGAIINRNLGSAVPGTSYKVTFYAYGTFMSNLQSAAPNVWIGSSQWNAGPFSWTSRVFAPTYIKTTNVENGWVKYEMVYPAFPYNDDGSIPGLNLCTRNNTNEIYYLDNFKVESFEPTYAVNFTENTVGDTLSAFAPFTVTDTTGTTPVKALKLDTNAEVIIPLDASQLTAGKYYSVMVGTANRTDFVNTTVNEGATPVPYVDSELKVNLYTKVDGNWVDSGMGTSVKATDLFAHAEGNTGAKIQLMTNNKFCLPSAESGEYAIGLKYTNGDTGLDLTYITMANIHIPEETADLFLEDDFSYEVTEGAENGVRLQSIGSKEGYWTGGWGSAQDSGVVEKDSVKYVDENYNTLQTSGNKLHHGTPWECNLYRTFALKNGYTNIDIATDNGELGLPGTTVYASFLFSNENNLPRYAFSKGGGSYRFGNAGWYPAMNNPAIHIQVQKNSDNKQVFKLMDSNAQTPGQSVLSDVEFENNKVYFMVLKMEFGTENKFSLYVNPTLGSEPENADVVLTNNMTYALDSILIDGQNTFNSLFDEFKLAKTYEAATPMRSLDERKEDYKDDLTDYLNNTVKESWYSVEGWHAIDNLVKVYENKIDSATTPAEMQMFYDECTDKILHYERDGLQYMDGALVRRIWNNVGGNNLSALNNFILTNRYLTNDYDSVAVMEQNTYYSGNIADNFVASYDGYVIAPQTGKYTFRIQGSDDAVIVNLNYRRSLWYNGALPYINHTDPATSDAVYELDMISGERVPISILCIDGSATETAWIQWKGPGIGDGKTFTEIDRKYLACTTEYAKEADSESITITNPLNYKKINLITNDNGTISGYDPTGYNPDSTAVLTATPNEGYGFAEWVIDDKTIVDGKTLELVMDKNHKVTALFLPEVEAEQIIAVKALKAYKNADDYRNAQKIELANAIVAGETAINACSTMDGVATALANAKAVIDGIKTNAQLTAEELAKAKTDAKTEISSYVSADDYRDAEKAILANTIEEAKTAIDACTVIGDVATALANAKAAIDEIKTNAQLTAEELAKAKADAKTEISSYVSADDYRDAEKAILANAIEEAKTTIDACTVIDDVATALANAKATIDEIKTAAEYDLEEAIAAAKKELDQYKNADDYRDAEKEALANTIEEAKVAIEAAESIDEVNSLLAEAKSSMDEIKTNAQLTLEEAKAAAIAELESYKNPNDYRDAEKEALANAIEEAKVAIEAATDTNAITAALASAKESLDVIKTDAQLKEEESKATPVPTTAPTTTPNVSPTPAVNKVKKIKFTKKKVKIKKGKTVTLKVKLTSAKGLSKAAKNVKWSINKKGKKIVKFVKKAKKLNGKLKVKIKAIQKGKAKITCKAPSGKKVVCKITVK